MSLELLRTALDGIRGVVAALVNHPVEAVKHYGQSLNEHLIDATTATDNIANDLNKVEADTCDAAPQAAVGDIVQQEPTRLGAPTPRTGRR